MLAEHRGTIYAAQTHMRLDDDDLDDLDDPALLAYTPFAAELQRRRDRPGTLEFLHGHWVDEVSRATIFIDSRTSPPRAVFSSGDDDELTGVYEGWYFDGRQYYATFRWTGGVFEGFLVLQIERQDVLNGGWWHARDVPPRDVERLPFVQGMKTCRWIRASDHVTWAPWAAAALGMPGRDVTAYSLLREPPPPAAPTKTLPGVALATTAPTAEPRYRDRMSL